MISAEIKLFEGKTLLGRARNHVVVTDRPTASGGRDLGCTSGELMLLSVGSCVMGSLRGHVERNALPVDIIKADVFVEPPAVSDGFGPLIISAELDGVVTPEELLALTEAAGSGRVARRFRAISQIEIRVTVCASPPLRRREDGAHRPAKISNSKEEVVPGSKSSKT